MMLKYLTIVVLGIMLIGLTGCKFSTPEIRGIVLDTETKEPVAEAWVWAGIEVETKTVGGDVHSAISLDIPHTRTDKEGRFLIPSKDFRKPLPPFGFGLEVLSLGVGANTIDDRGGSLNYYGGIYKRDFGAGAGDLNKVLKSRVVELTIYVKPIERTESEYFGHLQSLYNYCLTGRSSVEIPPVEGGCDDWELNYAIIKHERYLERYRDVVEKDVNTVVFDQLAYLYKRKGNYEKAIETLRKSIALIERRGFLKFEVWQRNKAQIERKINELQQKLQQKQK